MARRRGKRRLRHDPVHASDARRDQGRGSSHQDVECRRRLPWWRRQWGGSYLTVPASGDNVDAAKELAAWLTAPEQQLEALAAPGPFPSQVRALDNVTALNEAMAAGGGPTNAEFFDSDALGAIFSNRANAVRVPPFKGEY